MHFMQVLIQPFDFISSLYSFYLRIRYIFRTVTPLNDFSNYHYLRKCSFMIKERFLATLRLLGPAHLSMSYSYSSLSRSC